MTGGGNSNIFWNFHPEPWGNDPIWRAYFSDGLWNHQLDTQPFLVGPRFRVLPAPGKIFWTLKSHQIGFAEELTRGGLGM